MAFRAQSFVFALFLFGVHASADVPSKDVQRQARSAFDAGEKLFNQQKYEAALIEFRRAFELMAHDAVRFNIAVCLERLGRPLEAVDEYEAASRSATLGPKDLARARSAADIARRSLGHLSVKGAAGVEVKVDDRTRCQTPCQLDLDPRSHRIQVGSAAPVELAIQSGREHVLLANAEAPASDRPVPAPRVVAPQRTPAEPQRDSRPSRGPGFLTWTGGAFALIGAGGTVFFGLRTRELHDEYKASPTQERLDDGNRSKLFTNVSIGVAAVGATLVVVDLLFFAPEKQRSARSSSAGLRF
jgi:hypothetical protein